MKKNKAFTLIELLVVIAIIALLIGILLPAIGKARDTAKNVLSQNRMRQLGVGANSYGADNSDLLFSYSWKGPGPGEPAIVYDIGGGRTATARTDVDAADAQNTEILGRITGRTGGPTEIVYGNGNRLWHRRWNHVVLLDYLTETQPEPIAASPFDKNQILWAAEPDNYAGGSGVPYAPGNTVPPGYEPAGEWSRNFVRQRWAFASSYQTVPAVWNSDGINTPTYAPTATTPHLFAPYYPPGTAPSGLRSNIQLGGRRFNQVAHPSGKVLQFEEFDRFGSRQGVPWMYPEAQCNLSFFDASVRRISSSEVNPGWNPADADAEWRQAYIPLDTFPEPKGGPGDNTAYCQRYRWTRYGLQGIDVGAKEVGRPRNLPDPPVCVQ